MRKALVKFPVSHNETKEVESSIIENQQHIEDYKTKFPHMYPMVVHNFVEMLGEGEKIIVNRNGGWCNENDDIKILKYLD